MISPDFGSESLPDRVSPEELGQARNLLGEISQLDAESIPDSVALARRLKGVHRAISSVVLARSVTDVEALSMAHSWGARAEEIIDCKVDPTTGFEHIFIAALVGRHGADLQWKRRTTPTDRPRLLRSLIIPTDETIDDLLENPPSDWWEPGVYAEDFRELLPHGAYPFYASRPDYASGREGQEYARMLREATSEFLQATE